MFCYVSMFSMFQCFGSMFHDPKKALKNIARKLTRTASQTPYARNALAPHPDKVTRNIATNAADAESKRKFSSSRNHSTTAVQ
jgi:hypothetical protein